MTSIDLSPPSTDDDVIIDISSSTTEEIDREQLKLKFRLALIDDETISGETFTVSNFVSCIHCFTTYRYGSSSIESISHHECSGPTSSFKSATTENSSTLDKHFMKQKNPFRLCEQRHLTKLFTNWICDD
ncbi:unnamed protein product [Rotaria sp. Silwood2]|nr:unnamed protein product [Rotaria sp. Silwood2]CAF4342875.1 unnamed protein product [Rotaria sp. Silwood2]